MGTESNQKRRGGSLVIPLLLIVLGVLLLLDNLNVVSIDWASIWKLWPLLLVAIGVEIILGRRVSGGAILLLIIAVIIGGASLWWSALDVGSEWSAERITWPMDGVERAELELDVGLGELVVVGQSDMSDLLVADLDLAPGVDVTDQVKVTGDVARGSIVSDRDFFAFPQIFGRRSSEWGVWLNEQVGWTLDVNAGVGDTRLDLSDARVGVLELSWGVGSVDVILPQKGAVRAVVDGGVGDVTVTIPPGAQARISVDQGIGDLNIGSRFERQDDYYETEGFSSAESSILLEVDLGIGSITVR
jgi:hypothetical protein